MSKTIEQIVSENLRRFREDAKLTQKDVAFKLGVTLNTVSRWETGAHLPSIADAKKIADVYHVKDVEIFKDQHLSIEEALALIAKKLGFDVTRKGSQG